MPHLRLKCAARKNHYPTITPPSPYYHKRPTMTNYDERLAMTSAPLSPTPHYHHPPTTTRQFLTRACFLAASLLTRCPLPPFRMDEASARLLWKHSPVPRCNASGVNSLLSAPIEQPVCARKSCSASSRRARFSFAPPLGFSCAPPLGFSCAPLLGPAPLVEMTPLLTRKGSRSWGGAGGRGGEGGGGGGRGRGGGGGGWGKGRG